MDTESSNFIVNGLVDGRGASALLGFGESNPRRFSTWLAKAAQLAKAGKDLSPLLALLPEPAGQLNGAPVYTVEAVLAFGELAEGLIGSKGRPAKPVEAEAEEVEPAQPKVAKEEVRHTPSAATIDALGDF